MGSMLPCKQTISAGERGSGARPRTPGYFSRKFLRELRVELRELWLRGSLRLGTLLFREPAIETSRRLFVEKES